MTTVTAVSVQRTSHSPLRQPNNGCNSSGSSEVTWSFKGVYLDQGQCVVVVEAGASRDAGTCKVDGGGGIFPGGSSGVFCELTLSSGNLDNWTVKVATDKDRKGGKGVVFQAGSGFTNGSGAGRQ